MVSFVCSAFLMYITLYQSLNLYEYSENMTGAGVGDGMTDALELSVVKLTEIFSGDSNIISSV